MIAISNSLPAFCNSDNITLVNSFDNQPQMYVACLASYNNGGSHGVWIDATQEVEEVLEQITTMLSNSPEPGAEEYAIHDCDGFHGLTIERHADIEDVHEKAMFILEQGELGAKLITYYGGDLEDAQEALNEDYHGEYENELDYATAFFDECYLETVPDTVRYYIDYDSFKTDIFIDDCFSIEVGGKSHIFARH
jgi:antirestriction protein